MLNDACKVGPDIDPIFLIHIMRQGKGAKKAKLLTFIIINDNLSTAIF